MLSAGWLFGASAAGMWFVILSGLRELAIESVSTVSTLITVLILAECGLFATLFWSDLEYAWSTGHEQRSGVLPRAQGLVLGMTTVLSALSIAMGNGFINGLGMKWRTGYPLTVLTTVLVGAFCWLLVSEYRAVNAYANDSAILSSIFILTGVHFGHVCTGLVLLWMVDYGFKVDYRASMTVRSICSRTVHRAHGVDSGLLLYVHFVEAAWIGIHVTAYI